MAFEHYQSEGPDKHTPSQKSYPPWSIPGHGYSDDVPSSFLDSLKSSSERWLAPLAVFPALAGCILTALQEYVIARHKPLDMGPALPCCTPGVCMSGRAASSGLCGDVTFVECSWRRRFSVCYATTRRTRPGNTDACAVDTLRVFALPPLAAVPVASLVLSIITASRTEMPFQFSAWGEVFSGSEQVGFATITYTVTGSGVCLTTVSPTLVDAGYQSSACSGLGQGRLALTQGFQQLPQGEDFTTLSVPYIASQLPIAAAAAPAALVMNTIVVLCMTSFLVCNLRHGRAAKAFAVWGRVVAILLGLACVGSLIANVAGYDAKQSMCRGYFEAAGATAELRWCWVGELGWDSGSFDPITLPQLLRKLINPISLPYTFVPEFASVQSNIPLIFNDECLVVSAIQLVLFVPVAVVAFLATLEGSADGEGARADAALTPSDQGAGAESGPAAAGSCRTDGHDSAPSAAEDQGRRLRVASAIRGAPASQFTGARGDADPLALSKLPPAADAEPLAPPSHDRAVVRNPLQRAVASGAQGSSRASAHASSAAQRATCSASYADDGDADIQAAHPSPEAHAAPDRGPAAPTPPAGVAWGSYGGLHL